jgi:hypothetical protein
MAQTRRLNKSTNWRDERIGDGLVIASSPVTRIAARVLSARAATEADRSDILRLLSGLARAFSYSRAIPVDLDGNVRIQLNPDHSESAHLRESGYPLDSARRRQRPRVGRAPSPARRPCLRDQQRDAGVPRGPGGPPHEGAVSRPIVTSLKTNREAIEKTSRLASYHRYSRTNRQNSAKTAGSTTSAGPSTIRDKRTS